MKRCNRSLIMYEVRNIAGNIFVHLFGIGLPILLSLFISSVASKDVPEFMKQRVVTSVAITMSLIIPMAIMLIGYAANYAQEVERNVPTRMYLFGFSEKSMMLAKAIAQLIFLTGAMLIYMVAEVLFLDIQKPALLSFLFLLACLYLVGILFFLFAHGISNLLKKFGPTYAVTMTMYFLIMILSGMMGMGSDQLPEPMKTIAYTLPTTYISNEFIDFWQGQHYNFMPLIQSFLFFGTLAGIVVMLSLYQKRKSA